MSNVNLGSHFDRFVQEKLTEGRYQNASEVVRAGLRLLEDAEATNVRRQRLWDQIGNLNNGRFLAHRNPKESGDEPETRRPTGLVTVLCRSFDHILCSKGDEPWAQAGRMNFVEKRCA